MDLCTTQIHCVGMKFCAPPCYRFNESHTYTLERDPSNRYDSKAIKILDLDDGVQSAHIGWVLRDDNQSLARLMDAGHVFTLHGPARLTDSTYVFQCTDESEIETLLAYEAELGVDGGGRCATFQQ